jgi:hypothetical protein
MRRTVGGEPVRSLLLELDFPPHLSPRSALKSDVIAEALQAFAEHPLGTS